MVPVWSPPSIPGQELVEATFDGGGLEYTPAMVDAVRKKVNDFINMGVSAQFLLLPLGWRQECNPPEARTREHKPTNHFRAVGAHAFRELSWLRSGTSSQRSSSQRM